MICGGYEHRAAVNNLAIRPLRQLISVSTEENRNKNAAYPSYSYSIDNGTSERFH
jgi:hypothetical protein